MAGGIVGVASTFPQPTSQAAAIAREVAGAAVGLRKRPPRPGDDWGGCNDARAAGAAPIYRGEPGYREDMDGDGDGIACEPIRD